MLYLLSNPCNCCICSLTQLLQLLKPNCETKLIRMLNIIIFIIIQSQPNHDGKFAYILCPYAHLRIFNNKAQTESNRHIL